MKKVSVIVPVYNVEKYIDKCLNSLVNQTLEDIEIIVVNDGTKDNSQKIIDEYVRKYPNKVFSYIKKNGGLSSARNYGLKKATGEYVGFVDSDDYVEFNMYELMYNKAKETNSDVVCCQVSYRFSRKVEKRYFSNVGIFGKSISERPEILLAIKSFAWNKIYKRKLWDNFAFPNQYFEDSAIIYNLMYNANRIECVNYPLYNYIKERDNQITATIKEKVIYDIFKSCDNILNYYKNLSVDKEVIEYLCINHLIIRFGYMLESKQKRITFKYYDDMISYLNTKIKKWRKNRYLKLNRSNRMHFNKIILLKNSILTKFFILISINRIKLFFIKIKKYIIKVYNHFFANNKKIRNINVLNNGYKVLNDISKIMNKNDILCFADFGTLLGLIRDKKILDHDLDIDLGIVIDDRYIDKVNCILEQNNFILWREYIGLNKVIERSYYYENIKIDFNFYYNELGNTITYLFFRNPSKKYNNGERSIVKMTYSKIVDFKQLRVNGFKINVPFNAEKLLEEKYGKNWKVPDKNWIYWMSPSASILEDIGYYVTCNYVLEEF